MPRPITIAAVLVALAGLAMMATPALAHLHALIPERPAVTVRDKITIALFFGHPFEHQVADTPPPEALRALLPAGPVLDLVPRLVPEKDRDADGKEVSRFRFSFEPGERGDCVVAFASRPRLEKGPDHWVKDFAKVVVHVQAERGWDRAVGDGLEIVPLTRPYGLKPGSTFLARALLEGKPLEGAAVEVERYNPAPPAKLPEEEFITRTARTGPGGLIAATLDEAGWWAVTVTQVHGTLAREGKELPLTLRAMFWVYAGEPLDARR